MPALSLPPLPPPSVSSAPSLPPHPGAPLARDNPSVRPFSLLCTCTYILDLTADDCISIHIWYIDTTDAPLLLHLTFYGRELSEVAMNIPAPILSPALTLAAPHTPIVTFPFQPETFVASLLDMIFYVDFKKQGNCPESGHPSQLS